MNRKQKLLIGGGLVALIFIIGGWFFWLWQRSQARSIEYQSEKKFEALPIADMESAEALKMEEPDQTATQIETGGKAEAAKPAEETASAPKGFAIKSKLVSFGHESTSGRDINTIVLHSSHGLNGDPYNVDDVVALWKSYGVAPHYMIARDGTVYQLVADKNIAYHAGEGKMPDGRTGVNNFSIGVEILNTKTDSYTSAQYQATKDLISYLKKKYGKMEVVGHDTIAPGRKTDPWNFNWSKI